jgi:hypothetical protein
MTQSKRSDTLRRQNLAFTVTPFLSRFYINRFGRHFIAGFDKKQAFSFAREINKPAEPVKEAQCLRII